MWLVCTYLLLTDTITIVALVSNWSSTFGEEVFGSGLYADPDWIHFALIVTNTLLWLAIALNLYRMSYKAVRLLGIAFAVGVVDIYRQATYGWVAHRDRAQYLKVKAYAASHAPGVKSGCRRSQVCCLQEH